ncbi:DDE superfamily endonuclease [Nitzschia inconspicua]|uniref:DDE superfamily endonuclease n=1 Tax=Nitzschia inconspicua TaxID=303405 RepID=A0A9K3Q5H6_9STRA|nr:DDE superfamily endonuclease [Nitzschia inconspicua]
MESDDDYSTSTRGTEVPNIPIERAFEDGEDLGVSASRSAVNYTTGGRVQKVQAYLPKNLQDLSQMKNHVTNQLKGCAIDENLSLRVIKRVLLLQESHLQQCAKKKRDHKGNIIRHQKPAIAKQVCATFGIGNSQYSKIVTSYFTRNPRERVVYSTAGCGLKPGNATAKERRIPLTVEYRLLTQAFIRQKRANRERVTARQLVDFLVEKGLLHIERDDNGAFEKKGIETACRAARRFVDALGFVRGGRSGNLVQKKSVLLQKEHYLRAFIANREASAEDRLREVYLGESYIHEHYHRNDDSLWDPNDDQDIQYSKAPAKGKRYFFAAAIQGPDPRVVQHDGLAKERKAGLVPNTLWVFRPQNRGANTGDYHKVFDGENFVNWWKTQLLPNLHQPSLIMMDNASYHKVKSAAPKLGKMKKQEIKEWLQGKGVPLQDNMTALALRECARKYIKESIPMDCVKAAEEMGHKVLFTPPYHSDLHPIELVWALVKGNVGRQYNKNTTMKLVYERLIAEFHKLEQDGHQLIEKMVDKCANLTKTMYEEILEADNDEDCVSTDEEDEEEGIPNNAEVVEEVQDDEEAVQGCRTEQV